MGTILVIDDEEGIRSVMARLLTSIGHQVQVAPDGARGLALLDQRPFDLVYCDIRIPDGSGLDLLKELHTRPGNPLVIMMTGFPTLESAQQAIRHGAFDYLVKPVEMDTLFHSVNQALGAKALQNEKERLRLHLEAVFNSVNEALVTVDANFNLLAVNHSAERLCGFRREEIGYSFDIRTERCSRQCLTAVRQVFQQGGKEGIARLECQREHRPAQVVSVTATPLVQPGLESPCVVMAVRDDTRVAALESNLIQRRRFHRLVGASRAMQQVYHLIEALANLETTVLILGESGTGKELVADAIHHQGQRSDQPFIRVNCGALTETLLESELFGHVRGAFTGASRDRLGRFQAAHQGTILLDEIGDISPRMQLRLLRVLQDKTIERVGDHRPIQVDVRIIAATNQDLSRKVASGEFREDLLYRLRVVEVRLPPLRERREDIPLIIDHLIHGFNQSQGKAIQGVTESAMALLMNHGWPGNVRELEHAIEHGFVLCSGPLIEWDHLPSELKNSLVLKTHTDPDPPMTADTLPEREAILHALALTRWHREKAARWLGMSRSSFFRRLKQLGITGAPRSNPSLGKECP